MTPVLYIDLELTCWATAPPKGLRPEIIEVGVVEMDLNELSLTREQAYFVRPRRWEISEKCTRLTGITAENVKSGRSLAEVVALIAQQFAPAPNALLCVGCGAQADARNTARLHASILRRLRGMPEPVAVSEPPSDQAVPTAFGEKLRLSPADR